MSSQVILLNGPAAVGKSTVAEKLVEVSGDVIHGDQLRKQITVGKHQRQQVFAHAGKETTRLIKTGSNLVVFEYIFSRTEQLDEFLSAYAESAPVYFMSLWASLPVLHKRENLRKREPALGSANITDWFEHLRERPKISRPRIITDQITISAVATRVRAACSASQPLNKCG